MFTTAKSGTAPNGTLPRGVANQTRQALENLKELLTTAGTDMEHVLKTTVYLTTLRGFESMNRVYASYFRTPPARSIVLVKGWGPCNRLIEIEAIAGIP